MSSDKSENTKPEAEIRDSGFFVLRTPLLPFDDYLNWSANLTAPGSLNDREELALKLAKDREVLRIRLREIVLQPEVLEALFVASSDLHESLEIWQRNPESARGQRLEKALVRYFSRLTARATPFGLCAGISIGHMADKTELMLVDRKHYKRHTQIDMKYLVKLMASVALKPSFKKTHIYRLNTSLYRVADRFHYLEEERDENTWRLHKLVAVDASSLLTAALERASTGARISELIQTLTGLDGTTPAEAEEFVEELINNQLLVPDFGPVITGPDPLLDSIEQLKPYPEGEHLISRLETIAGQMEAMDKNGLGVSAQCYNDVAEELDQLTAPEKVGRYFKVDMIKPASMMTLGRGLVNQISRSVGTLWRLAAPKATGLQDFRSRFVERYGERELPLVTVLDEEAGLGFNFESFNAPEWKLQLQAEDAPGNANTEIENSAATSFLLRKILAAHTNGEQEIRLTTDDLELLAKKQAVPLPPSFAVRAVLIRQSSAENDYRIEITNVSGPSGANSLGRFCQAEPQLTELVQGHLRAEEEQYSDVAFAEIVHLPEEGIANVLCRPLFHEFEIPYLGRSGAPVERQIPLTDLLVSVKRDRIVLRSQRLNREVVPRLTSAHNFPTNRNLAVYRFLCLLQQQGIGSWKGLDWGILQELPFLPRVTLGRLLLTRARWKVRHEELSVAADGNAADRYVAVQPWRMKRKLPRYVAFVEYDNELLIDFDNVLSVEMFLGLLKKRGEATLVERFLSESNELFVNGPEGGFAGELIVPFVNTVKQSTSPVEYSAAPLSERYFPPGSEWIFLKFYCGPATVDRILYSLEPFINQVLTNRAADRWFFLRYNDPQWHLRLRFHGDPAHLRTRVLPQLQNFAASLLDAGLIWRMQIDTYDREIERYGGPDAIALAEEIFYADSTAALAIVSHYFGNAGAGARWLLTLRSVDQMLTDFGLTTSSKHEFVCSRLKGALPENLAKEFKRYAGEKYRKERKEIESVMTMGLDAAGEFERGLSAFQLRSEGIVQSVERLRTLEQEGKLCRPLPAILRSFTHMNVNRMLKTDLKLQETMAYDFLRRYYEWLAAALHKSS